MGEADWRKPRVGHFIGGDWVDSASGRSYLNRSPWSGETLSEVPPMTSRTPTGPWPRRTRRSAAGRGRCRTSASWSSCARPTPWSAAARRCSPRSPPRPAAAPPSAGCSSASRSSCSARPPSSPTGGWGAAPVGPGRHHGDGGPASRGVVAAIAPWNASLTLAGRAIVGPLALGNTVVLKPSEDSPYTGGALWAEILHEACLAGALNVVTHAPARPTASATRCSPARSSSGSTSPAPPRPAAASPRRLTAT